MGARDGAGPARTVAAGFLLYGALFADRLAPLFLADRIASELDVGPAALGLLPFAIAVGWTAGLAAGRWSNRFLSLRQRLLVGTLLAAALSLASAAAGSYPLLLLLRALSGVGANIASPALIALCVRAIPVHRRGTALGLVQSSTRVVGSFLAPIALTLVVAAAGWRHALVAAGATLAVTAAAVHILLPTERREGRRPVRARPPVYQPDGRRLIALAAGLGAVTFLWLTVISQAGLPLLESWLELDVTTAGQVLGWFGIGSTLAVLAVSAWSDRSRSAALAWSTATTAAAGVTLGAAALVGAGPPTAAVAALFAVAGLGLGVMPMAISVLPADAVAEGDVDRAVEVPIVSAELLGGALLPALAFAAAARFGMEVVVIACATLFAVVAVVGALTLRSARRVPAS